ncbi:MAG: hypothetical protein LBC91_01590 [Candidatus Accumulibacter sp.]|nr:hypothetical protein [Accumulibacter sp.]
MATTLDTPRVPRDRFLPPEIVEGEIGLTIDYQAGQTPAVALLSGAMRFIEALDKLDKALLSSVNTSLEPVSILNDVQHSSLKLLLARALQSVPDDAIKSVEWKKWVGALLVKGKYRLLRMIGADTPEIARELEALSADYEQAPFVLVAYRLPRLPDILEAMEDVQAARAAISCPVTVQTELGNVELEALPAPLPADAESVESRVITNQGEEIFKVKSPDMLGEAQWIVLRNNRNIRVDMLHRGFVERYHRREVSLLPGDALRCRFEETIRYDVTGQEIDRKLSIIEVMDVLHPPVQNPLL